MKQKELFKILTIDGGGIRGIIPGQVLSVIEKKLIKRTGNQNVRIADYFDMIAGTSTGGILTLLYLIPGHDNHSKYTAEDAVNLYMKRGHEIFDISLWQKIKSGGGIIDEKYDVTALESALIDYFGDLKLNQLLKPCLITSYDIFNRKAVFFNQLDAFSNEKDNFFIRDVARATSAAPTYFECTRIKSMTEVQYYLIDGGVFANNPSLCAYAEARNKIGVKAADMAILSLGTGYKMNPYFYDTSKDWGLIEWAKPLLDIMMSGVSETVDYQLKQMFDAVDRPNQYLRLNTPLKISNTAMDDASTDNLNNLREEGEKLAEDNENEIDDFIELILAGVES